MTGLNESHNGRQWIQDQSQLIIHDSGLVRLFTSIKCVALIVKYNVCIGLVVAESSIIVIYHTVCWWEEMLTSRFLFFFDMPLDTPRHTKLRTVSCEMWLVCQRILCLMLFSLFTSNQQCGAALLKPLAYVCNRKLEENLKIMFLMVYNQQRSECDSRTVCVRLCGLNSGGPGAFSSQQTLCFSLVFPPSPLCNDVH